MPYASNNDLPGAVKSALPDAAQSIWRAAANSALEKKPQDEEAAFAAGWGAVKNAGWEKTAEGAWVRKQVNAATHEFDLEVMSTGTWKGDTFTGADLDEMVKNFTVLKDVVKPPIKFGHWNRRHLEDGQPALGWAKAVRRVGDKLIATVSDVPDIVYQAIRQKLYRRVSAEVYFDYTYAGSKFGRVLAAIGLLGQDAPAVENLADLTAYLSRSTPDGGSFGRVAAFAFETDPHGSIINQFSESEDVMEKAELERQLATEKAAREKAEVDAKKYAADLDAEKKQQAAARKTARETELKTFCEDEVKAGRMTPAGRDIIVNDLVKHVYSDEAGFGLSFETFKAYCAAQGKKLDTGEKGAGGDGKKGGGAYESAGQEVDAKAKKYAAEHKVAYSEAVKIVLNEDDDLAGRYFDEEPVLDKGDTDA